MLSGQDKNIHRDVAVVGMICRVPGAKDISDFWQLLVDGREGLRQLTVDEMQRLRIKREHNYIAAGGYIENIDLFDADFFNFTAREASFMDPQHRLWLQACWQALEVSGHAGHDNNHIGVFASAGHNAYLHHILSSQYANDQQQATLLGNVADCLATRVSYALNLTGPSFTIQSGCSSSLVAVHQARLALLAKQCDAALAGGINIAVPAHQGYTHVEGGFASPDGHCRPFSDDAAGTVFSSGYAVVVLKRLADAILDGDTIYAVIKGSAINNDGADKASFTAPGVHGQTSVIAKALRVADVTAESIQYVETHGTATPIGDPIELTALQQAFNQAETRLSRCKIGSVKANLGHLDVAAGIVGLIKTCLMLHNRIITPQINFHQWNLKCGAAEKSFEISTKLMSWEKTAATPRRAGVSAFGFGGTNAHIILEESLISDEQASIAENVSTFIPLSAKTPERLMLWIKTLRQFLEKHPACSLTELAYTLQTGRKQWSCRFIVSASTITELISTLKRINEADFVICDSISQTIIADDKNRHEVQQAWLSGKSVNWKSAWQGKRVRKLVLPAAPSIDKSYWIEKQEQPENSKQLNRVDDYKQWLYQPVWQEKVIPVINRWRDDAREGQPILVVGDGDLKLTSLLIDNLKENNIRYYHLTHIADFASQSGNDFSLHGIPKIAVFIVPPDNFDISKYVPMLFNLVRHKKMIQQLNHVTFVMSGMNSFCHPDNHPDLAILTGFARGISQEFPTIKTQLLDIDENISPQHQLIQVISSIKSSSLLDLAVWRDNKCWQFDYQCYPANTAKEDHYFKQDGVYIITGGLGDVGSVHVDFLAKEYNAKLILPGRTDIPDSEQWDELLANQATDARLRKKLQRLQAWRKAGYHVSAECVDITNIDEMQSLSRKLINHYGRVDGIIHIAGEGSDMHYKILTELDWPHCWKLLAPKLTGLRTIAAVMNEFNIQDCLIISSISSCLAGIGLSAYAATHNILDMVVGKSYPDWRIMNWDAWNFHQSSSKSKEHGELGAEIDKLAITPDEGLNILKHAFTLPAWRQLFVSTANLGHRYRYWTQRGFIEKQKKQLILSPRPVLHNEYVQPSDAVQQKLADIWSELLAIESVGIHDSFFELGGSSLLALEFIHSLQREFQYVCSVVDLFASPTIAQLASNMTTSQTQPVDMAALVSQRVNRQRTARYQQLIGR